ncbi:glucokinase [Parasedimentitalea maritima]|uniref:Glucokinase n=1 Tax=Parasedimentitalea maritima TaxID=2578117 RepID=A0A6A4RL99_9RHOB|nr:glucokinase [Zongyanglinia marina]KAE9630564.1 glucokinase [Zongyanglinia marina]
MNTDVTVLVGDVGGSNTRLALAGPGIGVTALKSFDNECFTSLEEVLATYRAQPDLPDIQGACIAVAGPVYGNEYRLTNRNWHGDAGGLARQLQLPDGARMDLINDLAALGYALPVLIPGQLASLKAGHQQGDQALVVGIGTGFNVALVVGTQAAGAELGHARLPASVYTRLEAALGRSPDEFDSTENLFSGHGLVRFHLAMSGAAIAGGAELMEQYLADPNSAAARTVETWAELLGLLACNLVPTYMPGQGLFFAGSVARGVLNSPAQAQFLAGFDQIEGLLQAQCQKTPLWVITDDAAGVSGSARVALDAVRTGAKAEADAP